MAKIDLTSLDWCNLVFENKNKSYGAYKMRMDSPKRHSRSVIIVLILSLVLSFLPTLMRLAAPKQKVENVQVVSLSKLKQADVKQKEMKKIQDEPTPPQAVKSSVKFTAPVIKKDEEVNEDEEIKSQNELLEAKGSISIADVKGNDEVNGKDIADLKQIVTQAAPEDHVFDVVEVMPTFPGGMDALVEYLRKHIRYPASAEENGIQGRVTVVFVVEKDGSVTDVKVARGVDPSLDREAVRVVSSMPHWLPGKQNGSAVRVKFSVPVTFRLAS
jgi:protein TonB